MYFSGAFSTLYASGTQKSNSEELWVDKYKPNLLKELAVHKKKVKTQFLKFLIVVIRMPLCFHFPCLFYLQVEEVKMWFEERLKPSKVINIEKELYDYYRFVSYDYYFGFHPLSNVYPFKDCYSLIVVDLQNNV